MSQKRGTKTHDLQDEIGEIPEDREAEVEIEREVLQKIEDRVQKGEPEIQRESTKTQRDDHTKYTKMDLGPRNNTNFQSNLSNALRSIDRDRADFLLYHHRLVHEYILKYDEIRGMLFYHQTGSGKSILSADLCHGLIKKKGWHVLFISTKSLHDNFRENLRKYYRMNPELRRKFSGDAEAIEDDIDLNYKFISLNASNLVDQVVRSVVGVRDDLVKSVSLDNHVVVIDEAHNFANAVSGGSKNAVGLYDMLLRSQRIKILLLSATPCVNDIFEATIYFNILAG